MVFQLSRIFMAVESPFILAIVFLVGNPFRRQYWLWKGVISTKARKTFMWWRRKRSESLHRMCKLHLLDDLRVMILRDRLFYANAWLKRTAFILDEYQYIFVYTIDGAQNLHGTNHESYIKQIFWTMRTQKSLLASALKRRKL